MAHENLKVDLVGKPGKTFVKNLTVSVYDFTVKISEVYGSYDFINYRMFEEVTVREYTGRLTKYNEPDPDHYRFDCIIFVEPNRAALNKKQVYTVGIELKNSKADLMADDKMEHYIGYTDFFFIGVPAELVEDAINRACDNEFIGVFCVDDGKIYLMPHQIKPTVENQKNLLEQIMYSRMFGEDFKGSVSFKLDDIEVSQAPLKDDIERGIAPTETLTKEPEESEDPEYERLLRIKHELQGPEADFYPEDDYSPTEPVKNASEGLSGGHTERTAEDIEAEKAAAREKEQMRREKHDAKVAVLQEEVNAMNEEVPAVVASILEGMSLGDQRIYHAIRRNNGIQAQNIAEILPYQEGVERPSLATVKRSISALTKAGLIEREGSKKTGQYITKEVDCTPDSCQVCAKSPLCTQFQQI